MQRLYYRCARYDRDTVHITNINEIQVKTVNPFHSKQVLSKCWDKRPGRITVNSEDAKMGYFLANLRTSLGGNFDDDLATR